MKITLTTPKIIILWMAPCSVTDVGLEFHDRVSIPSVWLGRLSRTFWGTYRQPIHHPISFLLEKFIPNWLCNVVRHLPRRVCLTCLKLTLGKSSTLYHYPRSFLLPRLTILLQRSRSVGVCLKEFNGHNTLIAHTLVISTQSVLFILGHTVY